MTPLQISAFLGLLVFIDLLFTYSSIRMFKNRYPKYKDWAKLETNFLIRWAWEHFGFEFGSVLSPLLISPFFFVMIVMSVLNQNYLFLFTGAYIVVFVIHGSIFALVLNKEPTGFDKAYNEVYSK